MKNLLISGDTDEMVDWDMEEAVNYAVWVWEAQKNSTLKHSRKEDRDRMVDWARGQQTGPRCDGMTYDEIETFNAENNFWKY